MTTTNESYYFHKADWSINTDPKNGIKVNVPIVFMLTPILGALFLMFLPVIGFALLFQQIFNAASDKAVSLFAVHPMVPGEAHFTGKKPSDERPVSPTVDERLDELAKEINNKRK